MSMNSIETLSHRSRANNLLKLLKEQPELLTNVTPVRERIELKTKPKSGEKVLDGKPHYNRSVDYEAIDLKTDLEIALKTDDYKSMVICYFQLIKLLGI